MALALDADAVIAFLDRSDALHEPAQRAVRKCLETDREPLVASAVTYAEVLTGALLDHQDTDTVRGFFAQLVSEVIPADAVIAEEAARLRSSARLRMPDALVVATAAVHPDVGALLTGDRAVGRVRHPGLRIRVLSA